MASFQKFNVFVQDLGRKVHNLNADTLKIFLTNSAPAATDTAYDDAGHTLTGSGAAEAAGGNGYTQGGATVASNAYSQSGGTAKLTGNAVTFTAAGGSIAAFRYLVLYNSTGGAGGARPIIGWWDYGATVNLTDGSSFVFGKDAAGGNWDSANPILSNA